MPDQNTERDTEQQYCRSEDEESGPPAVVADQKNDQRRHQAGETETGSDEAEGQGAAALEPVGSGGVFRVADAETVAERQHQERRVEHVDGRKLAHENQGGACQGNPDQNALPRPETVDEISDEGLREAAFDAAEGVGERGLGAAPAHFVNDRFKERGKPVKSNAADQHEDEETGGQHPPPVEYPFSFLNHVFPLLSSVRIILRCKG